MGTGGPGVATDTGGPGVATATGGIDGGNKKWVL